VLLNRLIMLAIGCAVLAVAAPRFAPALLSLVVGPPADQPVAVDHRAPQPAPPPPEPAAREPDRPVMVERASGPTVALRADPRGHYLVDAVVNGRTIPVVIDTGATTVALSADTARHLGIYVSQSDYKARISTANGVVAAAPVTLREVRVHGISVRNVEAVVISGGTLPVSLLGMTFLSRLSKFQIAGGQLVLVQ
jgi:aspartyl protease family protein